MNNVWDLKEEQFAEAERTSVTFSSRLKNNDKTKRDEKKEDELQLPGA